MYLFELETPNEKLPSVKTYGVGFIARKHKVPLEQIKAQLEKGIKIEHEHTKDFGVAREIALDHLFELPDYYDRLEKIEKK